MPKYFDIEVSLLSVEPRIWRRFLIASDTTFGDLHDAIQAACGWLDYHLYEFLGDVEGGVGEFGLWETDAKPIARSEHYEPYDEEDERVPVAGKVKLRSYFPKSAMRCFYRYDFGDDWEHSVELKQTVDLPERFERRLVGGSRAFPPEDCASTPGYEECCEARRMTEQELTALRERDPERWDEVQQTLEWLGGWDPERFDPEAVRRAFDR